MKQRFVLSCLALALAVTGVACGPESDAAVEAEADPVASVSEALTGLSPERAIAAKLGLPSRLAIGLGNDQRPGGPSASSAFVLGPKVDIHYLYLSGLSWPTWNAPEGEYLAMHARAAKAKGVVPMFTLYQAAAWGENNLGAFASADFMTSYWRNVKTMYKRLNEVGGPSIVHVEPDLWGYFQKAGGDDPAKVKVLVSSIVPECADVPNTAAGFGKCIVRLGRQLSPKTAVGLHASTFGAYTNGASDPARVGTYLAKVAPDADFVAVETLDRDAGCFEVASDPNCKRSGAFYWDENNVQHPNFHDHLGWARSIRAASGKPLLWWQVPLGVPAGSGGWAGHYRDNRVRYIMSHGWEFAQAGGFGVVFGTGAANQTTVETDGGQFKNALTKYLSFGGNGLN